MNTQDDNTNPANPDEQAEVETINGVVSHIVYRSEDTGYTVCQVKVPGGLNDITIVGNTPSIWEGESVSAEGKWVRHKQHGHQFQAKSFMCIAPATLAGVEKYLASGLIRGIGKVMAARLVAKFGTDTLNIIEKESKRLEEVDGIGNHRRQMIRDSWMEHKSVRDIMIFLQGHGIGTANATRIHRQYGNDAIAIITENPYRLCRDVWGIGFKTADGVALSLGIPQDSPLRARAGIVYVLQTLTDEGHCYCPADELITLSQTLLGIDVVILEDAVQHEIARRSLIRENDNIYLTSLHEAEVNISVKLRQMMEAPANFRPIIVDKAVPWAEQKMKISFAPMQSEALKIALAEKVAIMTGGPGVGKTTIIRALVEAYKAREIKVVLAAPTGRAAKRMEEATGHQAMTLHRLLKFTPHSSQFEHNASNPLQGDVFILDEVSMIDVPLMSAFLSALPNSACLILVGDVDQLPSVGPGNVLRDLINSGVIPFRKLETIFRQQAGGWIVQNAHRVNHGEMFESPPPGENSDFYFLESDVPDDVIKNVIELVTNRIPKKFGFDPMNEIQVLTPMRRNQLGAENLNAVLQEQLNPTGDCLQKFGRKYRLGDRIMQIRNNYDKDVFNGDIGRITKINGVDQNLKVDYDDRTVEYGFSELDEMIHAYACSIHKAQGSEYPAVVILITTQHFKLLQRNLLYTAITRGRKLVCVVGSKKAIGMAIRNNQIRLRRTGLMERLQKS